MHTDIVSETKTKTRTETVPKIDTRPAGRAPMTPRQRWVLGLASMAAFMIALDTTIVTTALTRIHQAFHASVESLEWTVNAYVLSFAVLLLTGAALGDRFGRRRLFAAGVMLFTASSAACALAQSMGMLIAGRVFQGAGAALVMPLALAQVSAAFPPAQRGRVLGTFSGIVGLATFSGPFVGGAVAQGLAWQWLFWINVPIGVAVVVGVLARVDETFGPGARFDLGGVVLASGGFFGLVWALVRGNDVGWTGTETLVSLAVGTVLTAAFVRWEIRTAAPMLPMRFFRLRAFTAANVANFCMSATIYGVLFFMAQYYQTVLGYGPFGAGVRLMPWTGLLMVCAPVAGRLMDRFGERRFVVVGMLLQVVGLGWIALAVAYATAPAVPYPHILPGLVLGGCGLAMTMPAVQKASLGAVAPAEIAQASGAFNMLKQLGGLFGTAVSVAVFAGSGGYASARSFSDGFGPAMGFLTGLAVIGLLAGLCLPRSAS